MYYFKKEEEISVETNYFIITSYHKRNVKAAINN